MNGQRQVDRIRFASNVIVNISDLVDSGPTQLVAVDGQTYAPNQLTSAPGSFATQPVRPVPVEAGVAASSLREGSALSDHIAVPNVGLALGHEGADTYWVDLESTEFAVVRVDRGDVISFETNAAAMVSAHSDWFAGYLTPDQTFMGETAAQWLARGVVPTINYYDGPTNSIQAPLFQGMTVTFGYIRPPEGEPRAHTLDDWQAASGDSDLVRDAMITWTTTSGSQTSTHRLILADAVSVWGAVLPNFGTFTSQQALGTQGDDHIADYSIFAQLAAPPGTSAFAALTPEIFALGGNDVIRAYANDYFDSATGTFVGLRDTLHGGGGSDDLDGGAGNDTLFGNEGTDRLVGGIGNDVLDGGAGQDTLTGGVGDDVYYIDATDIVQEGSGSQSFGRPVWTETAVNTFALSQLQARGYPTSGYPTSPTPPYRYGENSYSWLSVSGQTVTEHVLQRTFVHDIVLGSGVDEVRSAFDIDLSSARLANVENAAVLGDIARTVIGSAGANRIMGNNVGSTLSGGAGDDTYVVQGSLDRIVELAGNGIDTVITSIDLSLLGDHIENVVSAGQHLRLVGNSGANTLTGDIGNNTLDGAFGADTLIGGAGDDTYIVDSANDVIVESAGQGHDQVWVLGTFVLGNNVEVEELRANSNGGVTLTGNAGANSLYGAAGEDVLNGGAGADQMFGGLGSDQYVVDNAGDVVSEQAGAGVDSVRVETLTNYTLESNVENGTLVLSGTLIGNALANRLTAGGGATSLFGMDGEDVLIGGAQADTLAGGTGRDHMTGGAGNDTYVIDNAGDVVVEQAGGGTDLVQSSLSLTLGAHVENLTLTGSGNVNGTGNALNNIITGNAGTNLLDGREGDDYLVDTAGFTTIVFGRNYGHDRVSVGSGGATVAFAPDIVGTQIRLSRNGTSLVVYLGADAQGAFDRGSLTLENYFTTATGYTLANGAASFTFADTTTWTALSIANRVSAAAAAVPTTGADTIVGAAGNDTISGANGNDLIAGGAGTDILNGGEGDDELRGEAGNDVLSGGNGTNFLDGGAGADEMIGGSYYDTFVVDDVGDVIQEQPIDPAYRDHVIASISYQLSSNLEDLTLTGGANLNGTGNNASNWMTGNLGNNVLTGYAGADLLNGGGGTDTLIGGSGNDSYVVDRADDVIVELAGEGTDHVTATYSGFVLSEHLENMHVTGTATGNAANNYIVGDIGANTLYGLDGSDTLVVGGAGVDTLVGGNGNDIYLFDREWLHDTIVEEVLGGTDYVYLSVAGTEPFITADNVENVAVSMDEWGFLTSGVDIVGNAIANTISGDNGDNLLDGGGGADQLQGYGGNDHYVVDNEGDVIVDSSGFDTVSSSVHRTLESGIEALFITNTDGLWGTGNALSNLLRGNVGGDVLSGGGGIDILEGGAGTDILSNAGGRGMYSGGEGLDTLTGGSSNELFIGGAHADILMTGTGADVIVFNRGDGQDTVSASSGADNTLSIGQARYADLLFQKSGNDLVLNVGVTDRITFTDYYLGTTNRSVSTLQVVIEGTAEYVSGSSDTLRDHRIETFNFAGLVAAFDAARTANPSLTSWALTNALLVQHLSGSNTAAVGGDLAYRYNRYGALSDVSFNPALGILGAAGFGTSAQTLQSLGSLQDSSLRLN